MFSLIIIYVILVLTESNGIVSDFQDLATVILAAVIRNLISLLVHFIIPFYTLV